MKRIKDCIYIILFFTILLSCEKITLDTEGADPNKKYSFSTDIQPIFDSKCVSCHKGTPPPDLQQNVAYNALLNGSYIKNPVEAEMTKLYKILYASSHSSKTTEVEKDIITLWMKQGAKNN